MRPRVRFLEEDLVVRIVEEARDLLASLGVEIHNPLAVSLLLDRGASRDSSGKRILIPGPLIDSALAGAPRSFHLYDATGRETHDFSGDRVHFTPGSAAIRVLDHETGEIRE